MWNIFRIFATEIQKKNKVEIWQKKLTLSTSPSQISAVYRPTPNLTGEALKSRATTVQVSQPL
jgi:hypothetical protein